MQYSPSLKIGDPFTQTVFSPVADLSRRTAPFGRSATRRVPVMPIVAASERIRSA